MCAARSPEELEAEKPSTPATGSAISFRDSERGSMTLCARCAQPITARVVRERGVPYHVACFYVRAEALNPSPEAVAHFVVDDLG